MKRTLTLRRPALSQGGTLPRRPLDRPVPASFGQEQIWLHGQLAPDAPLYTESLTIRHRGHLDRDALLESFRQVARRHEIWQTVFEWSDGQLIQRVEPDLEPALRATDLRHLPANRREEAAIELARADLSRPFDLSRESGARAHLVTLGDDDQRLYLCLHHIVFDGISIYRVVLPDLVAVYRALIRGLPSPLPEPSLQYADFAYWQRQGADETTFQRLADYWRVQLAGAPATVDLPFDHPRPATQTFRGRVVQFELPADLTRALRTAAADAGGTVFMLLLAGFAATLRSWSGQSDLLIGSVSGGRDRPELERLVGYFLRTLILRADLHGNPTFGELVRRIADILLEALRHDGLPVQRLVRAVARDRNLSRSPLFQVTFSIEPPLPDLGEEWDLTEMDAGTAVAKFDLSIELEDRGRVITGRAIHSTDLFEAATIKALVHDYCAVLTRAAARPDARIDELAPSR